MEATLSPSLAPRTAGNENTRLLKLVALVFMITDHVGVVFFPGQLIFRLFGRIAFPLYAWCLVVGVEYTKNIYRYALRLLIGLVISQPCFVLALGENWDTLNIFASLLLGLFAIYGIRENRYGSAWIFPIIAIFLTLLIRIDYDWRGVALMIVLYAARKNRGALAAAFVSFCLFWGTNTVSVASLLHIPSSISFLPAAYTLLNAVSRIQFYAVLALPFLLIPMNKCRVRLPRFVAYALYPAHLLIIWVVQTYLMGA